MTDAYDRYQQHRKFRLAVSHAMLIRDWNFLDGITKGKYLAHGYSVEWQDSIRKQWYRDWKDKIQGPQAQVAQMTTRVEEV